MDLKISYDSQLLILTCTVTGYLTIESYQKALQEILSSNEYPCDVATLWDLRDMDFSNIDLAFQKKLVEVRRRFKTQRGAAKIALVYSDELAEPLIKQYSALSKDLSHSTKSFTSVPEAMYWLIYGDDC